MAPWYCSMGISTFSTGILSKERLVTAYADVEFKKILVIYDSNYLWHILQDIYKIYLYLRLFLIESIASGFNHILYPQGFRFLTGHLSQTFKNSQDRWEGEITCPWIKKFLDWRPFTWRTSQYITCIPWICLAFGLIVGHILIEQIQNSFLCSVLWW